MIVFVDNEHEKGYESAWGEKLLAARTRIKYRLEDISGEPCLIVRYNHITPDFLRSLDIRAVLISGSGTPADQYLPEDQAGLRAVFEEKALPTFGFCGGFQVMAETYGSELAPIGPWGPGQSDPEDAPHIFSPGMKQEMGYMPVQLTARHPVLKGLGPQPVMRQAHWWEMKSVPAGFENYACSEITPVQLIVHKDLPIMGTQFHPEYYTDEHPAGRKLIENFFKWAGIIAS